MLEAKYLNQEERSELKQLLSANQLCFNDMNDQGVQLFGVQFKDKNIGYFGYEAFADVALFRSMVVVAEARNKGYGSLIWQLAKLKLTAAGINDVYLLTNTAAPFFSKQGFKQVARTSAPKSILATNEFKEFCPADSVCMKINLSQL